MTTPSPNPVESLRALPELLPCPFCGGEAMLREESPFNVCCLNCEADSLWSRDFTKCVAAWNRRPAIAPDAAAINLIAAERQRQIAVEGWTHEHDDTHGDDQIAEAAAAYALPSDKRYHVRNTIGVDWVKPGERIRELVKAGALIIAEIERLQRLAKHSTAAEEGHG